MRELVIAIRLWAADCAVTWLLVHTQPPPKLLLDTTGLPCPRPPLPMPPYLQPWLRQCVIMIVCVYVCCIVYTIQHRTVLILFTLILQTISKAYTTLCWSGNGRTIARRKGSNATTTIHSSNKINSNTIIHHDNSTDTRGQAYNQQLLHSLLPTLHVMFMVSQCYG